MEFFHQTHVRMTQDGNVDTVGILMAIVAVFSSISTLAVAFLARFLWALRSDQASISVAPHFRVEVHDETPATLDRTEAIAT